MSESPEEQPITFSAEYVTILQYFGKVVQKFKDNKQALMFKPASQPGRVLISKKSYNCLVHINADGSHADIPVDELGFSDYGEFLRFISTAKYPAPKTSIAYSERMNSYGQRTNHAVISGPVGKFHLGLGKPGLFTADNDKLVPKSASADTFRLVARVAFSPDELEGIYDILKLLGKPDIFGVKIVKGKMTWFMKDGSGERQYTKDIEYPNIQSDETFSTEVPGKQNSDIRLFPASFIDIITEFPFDFVLEFRYAEQLDLIAIKGYASVPTKGTSIDLLIGTQESRSHASIGSYDVIQ